MQAEQVREIMMERPNAMA